MFGWYSLYITKNELNFILKIEKYSPKLVYCHALTELVMTSVFMDLIRHVLTLCLLTTQPCLD